MELHKPVGKDGEGEYTASTKGCFDVIETALPLVLESIAALPMPTEGRPFVVADYGTADAGTSLGTMNKIVAAIRAREPGREVSLQYEDQKDNEWKSVFNHALGHKNVTDAYGVELSSPYRADNGVFVSATGISFHQQAYPSSTVDFGMSYTAMHWLSSGPGGLVGRSDEVRVDIAKSTAAGEEWRSYDLFSSIRALPPVLPRCTLQTAKPPQTLPAVLLKRSKRLWTSTKS